MNTAIVVVGYNRANSLSRLLNSLERADYSHHDIPLVISIDRGNNQDVVDVANGFSWRYGEKRVIYQERNLGLRKHILKCGALTAEYGSVIILEDDLYVSPNFYDYAESALTFSQGKNYIGGISLYTHQYNVHISEPFYPVEDGYDNWYFQFASSWGQAWNREQWDSFMRWYRTAEGTSLAAENMPSYVSSWSDKSWLKYFIKYLIDSDKYFLYPRVSLTANFGDAGTHVEVNENTVYQIPLRYKKVRPYCFSEIEESLAVYDAFYESMRLKEKFGEPVCIDLYGHKPIPSKGRYFLSRKELGYRIIKSYACRMRPHEDNIINDIEGEIFFLYDLNIKEKNKFASNRRKDKLNLYCFKVVYRNRLFQMIRQQIVRDFIVAKKKIKTKK